MRRILAVFLLALILVLAISVPALAAPSTPPEAFGQEQAWLAQKSIKEWNLPVGRTWMAPAMWAIQSPWSGSPYQNGGEYIAALKEDASY